LTYIDYRKIFGAVAGATLRIVLVQIIGEVQHGI